VTDLIRLQPIDIAAVSNDAFPDGRCSRYPGIIMRRRTCTTLRHALLPAVFLSLLGPAAAVGQTVPPPGTPPAQVQQQIDGLGMREQLLSRIQASGMTPDQVRRRLASMGYDPRTLDPYLSADSAAPPPPTARTFDALRALDFGEMAAAQYEPPPEAELSAEEERLGLRVFGIDVFRRGSTEFEPVTSAAVPASYVLGPGDELVLMLTGDVEMVHMLAVTREGFVLIPQVGQVWVNGLTMEGLRDQLYTRLGQVYSGVQRTAGATTRFDVSLARPRTNQVYISGEVVRPGSYTVSPMASVLNALYQAGGPTASGSFRDVHIVRSGRAVERLDLYDFLLRGDNLDRARLEPGDVIFVPTHGERVAVRGAVTREAIYEVKPGETMVDALRFAGGTSAPAHLRSVRLTRVLPPSQRITPGVDRVVLDVDLSEVARNPAGAPRIEAGDEIEVLAVRDEVRNMVSLNGSVWRPGSYAYRPGMRAWDLIDQAQGLSPDAFTQRAHITRLNPADSSFTLIPFSLQRNGDGSVTDNPALDEYDVVTVFSRSERVEELPVIVAGAVRAPHTERYQQGMTLRDAIIRAGGLRRTADPVVEVARLAEPGARDGGEIAQIFRIQLDSTYFVSEESARFYLGRPEGLRGVVGQGEAAEFLLRPYDRIFVRQIMNFELPSVVRIAGEVAYPGEYTLGRKGERLREMVMERAGGLTNSAHAQGFRLYRDGALVNVDLAAVLRSPDHPNNLVLQDGDSMVVPEFNPVVLVRGAVNAPSAVLYRQGADLGYYIRNAGGYARDADKGRVHVRYANGSANTPHRKLLLFRSTPRPEPGSEITVPHTLPEDRFDTRGFVTDLVQITASIATVLLVVSRLR
jgi:polysaccharide biosynthesis/export protein